jgi:hypothetical protein
MKILSIIEAENGALQNVSSYPMDKVNEKMSIEAANEHFKMLIKNHLDEQKKLDKDIYKIILENAGCKSQKEFFNQCIEEGYFGYPHDDEVEYNLTWGTVYNIR